MTVRIPPNITPIAGDIPVNPLWYRFLLGLQGGDLSLFGFKSLFQNDYAGASEVRLADNGKSHAKEDASEVTLPNSLPDAFLTTIINGNDSHWMRVNFDGAAGFIQGREAGSVAALELAPMNILSVTKLRNGVFLVSGFVRNAP